MSKVLILYGTRYGTTKGISDEIEKTIKEKGFETESYNLKEVNQKNIPSLDQYDGIIIGTGIRMGMWTKTVKSFIEKRNGTNADADFIWFLCLLWRGKRRC